MSLQNVEVFVWGKQCKKITPPLQGGVFRSVAAVLAVVFAHKLGKRAKTAVVCLLSGVFAVVVLVGYFNLVPFYFNSGAVVFAVGDEYQICWSTSAPSTGYVEVGGEKYYAVVAGSIRNDAYPDHESVSAFRFTGTALEIREDGITVMFTDQNKDVKGVYEV